MTTTLEQSWKRGRKTLGDTAVLQPAAYGPNLYPTPSTSGDSDFYRRRQTWLTDPAEVISGWQNQELISLARQLFAQVGELGSAIVEKANYAVGNAFKPQYRGSNQKWGDAAEEWLHHQWMPNCDHRGPIFDFSTQLFLSSLAWDVDGDDLVVFTEDEIGFPKLSFHDSTAIGDGESNKLDGTRFDGAVLRNGIFLDRTNTMIGVRLCCGGKILDLSIAECQLLFEPEWRTPERGISRVARPLLDWCSLQDIDWYLKLGVKSDAAMPIFVHNESGRADTSKNWIASRSATSGDASATIPTDVKVESIVPGQFQYLRAGKGEKMEAFKGERPHPNVEAFIKRIQRSGMASIGWPFELLNPSEVGGAPVRLIQDKARHSVKARQKTLKRRALRCVQYAVSRGMEKGFIPRNSDPDDFLKWEFELPATLTVDAGYDDQIDQTNFALGTTTLAAICQKKGAWWEDTRKQRLLENKNLIDQAKELVAYSGDQITLREALDMMQRDTIAQRKDPQLDTPEPAKPARQEQ